MRKSSPEHPHGPDHSQDHARRTRIERGQPKAGWSGESLHTKHAAHPAPWARCLGFDAMSGAVRLYCDRLQSEPKCVPGSAALWPPLRRSGDPLRPFLNAPFPQRPPCVGRQSAGHEAFRHRAGQQVRFPPPTQAYEPDRPVSAVGGVSATATAISRCTTGACGADTCGAGVGAAIGGVIGAGAGLAGGPITTAMLGLGRAAATSKSGPGRAPDGAGAFVGSGAAATITELSSVSGVAGFAASLLVRLAIWAGRVGTEAVCTTLSLALASRPCRRLWRGSGPEAATTLRSGSTGVRLAATERSTGRNSSSNDARVPKPDAGKVPK